jgi:hypothetical protein
VLETVFKLTQSTINYQNEEDKVPEDHVTHWQEQKTFDTRAIVMEWEEKEKVRMRRREQARMAPDMFENTWEHHLSGNETENDSEQDHSYRHGPECWESESVD